MLGPIGGVMKHATILIVIVLLVIGCHGDLQAKPDILYDICKANNLFKIYDHENLKFTFNVQLPDKIIKRSWIWNIKQNKIFLDGTEQEISHEFINDIYWLLFPLKAYESRDQIELIVNKDKKSPLLNKNCTEVIVKYTSGKGYTPNDSYKLYVDEKRKIIEWAYLKESKEPPKRMTSWEDYRNINGIHLSLLRKGANEFKVWFADVNFE
jgi:hypothetical protein